MNTVPDVRSVYRNCFVSTTRKTSKKQKKVAPPTFLSFLLVPVPEVVGFLPKARSTGWTGT